MIQSGERPFVGSLVARSRLRRAVERTPSGAAWRSPRFWHATRRDLIGPSCPAARSCTSPGDGPASERPFAFVLQLARAADGELVWVFVAFGIRHPGAGVRASTNARTASSMGDSRHDVMRARRLRRWPWLGIRGSIAGYAESETCRLAACFSRVGPIGPTLVGQARRPGGPGRGTLRSPAKPRAAVSRRFAVARASPLIGRLMLQPRAIHR